MRKREFVKRFSFYFLAWGVLFTVASQKLAAHTPVSLDEQMKSFGGRLSIYSKCLRRTSSKEEWNAAKRTMVKDGVIMFMILGVGGAG